MYVCSLRTNKWSYDHRQEGAALGQKMSYIRQTAGDRGALKDIQIFGMSSWLRQVHDAVLKLFRELNLKVLNMEITRSTETETHNACALFTLRLNKRCRVEQLIPKMNATEGVVSVEEL